MGQWTPETILCMWVHLMYGKGGTLEKWGKKTPFNKQSWENRLVIWKKINLDPYLIPFMGVSPKWLIDLSVRPEAEHRASRKWCKRTSLWPCSGQSFKHHQKHCEEDWQSPPPRTQTRPPGSTRREVKRPPMFWAECSKMHRLVSLRGKGLLENWERKVA